jgi:two-component system OmpR family response regulator
MLAVRVPLVATKEGSGAMERSGRLLLVEDESVLRGLVAQFLRGARFQVVEAADGPEGVARFVADGPFDVVLVDLNLPGFSGVEVCRRTKRHRPDQPILICSAAIIPEHETALWQLGVDQFLTKPYHPEDLLARIRAMIRAPGPCRTPVSASSWTA